MKITKHANQRSKERNGWNDKTTERMVAKVLEKGIQHKQTKGNLHKWMTGLYAAHKRKGADIRLYGDKAYVFVYQTLITVVPIPQNLRNNMKNLIRPLEEKTIQEIQN